MNLKTRTIGWAYCLASLLTLMVAIQLAQAQESHITNRDRIGLNFIRPDVNRTGNYDFLNSGVWLAGQYQKMGVRWNRLAFSWVLVQPEKDVFNWEPYDLIVNACRADNINILATLGGHFDRPPVPAWAGRTLEEVVTNHPEYLNAFVRAWVERYKGKIQYWEILNEPSGQHFDLTLMDYVDKILKPGYQIIKSVDPQSTVLPCCYGNLPGNGSKTPFWDAARGSYDIANYHLYIDWAKFRREPDASAEENNIRGFRALMERHGEGDKKFWVTEIGWWGTGGIVSDPAKGMEAKPAYTGQEILSHPEVLREDALRAAWMENLFPRILAIPGCEKAFLWVSLDEFQGGFSPDKTYGRGATPFTLWGIIAGDKTWRKSAYTLQELLKH